MVTGIRVNETGSDRPPFENLSTYTRPAFGKQMVFYPVTFTPCSRTSSNGEFKFKQFNQLFLLRFGFVKCVRVIDWNDSYLLEKIRIISLNKSSRMIFACNKS